MSARFLRKHRAHSQESNVNGQIDYTYDDRGNRLTLQNTNPLDVSMDSTTLSYNALNQLKTFSNDSGTTVSYTYYSDGLRATKMVNGTKTRYVYLNGKIIEELSLDANGNVTGVTARNIWGNSILFRKDNTSGKSGYFFSNGHGDIVRVTDVNGNVLNSYEYDIWGNVIVQSETMSNPFKYTGEVLDNESGYYYLRARYYDPSIGRFINEDTYEGDITNPLSLNLYTYVENNPLTHWDPTGHSSWAASILGEIATGGSISWEAVAVGAIVGVGPALLAGAVLCGLLCSPSTAAAPSTPPTVTVPKKTELTVIPGGKTDSGGSSNDKPKIIPPTVTSPVNNDKNSETAIYRYGNYSLLNFTPTPGKDDQQMCYLGEHCLSFNLNPPKGKNTPYSMTTLEKVNSTGGLKAYVDNPANGHVAVAPVNNSLWYPWIDSYNSVSSGGTPFFLTTNLFRVMTPIK